MSRDIKYIGMDVHKEAIVIAVLEGSGRMVMETILETKASSILEFLRIWCQGRSKTRPVRRSKSRPVVGC
jgi:hypothetical protein